MSGQRRRPVLIALAIALLAANLRPALAGFSPLVDEVQAVLGLSAATVSLVTTLPLVCFGVFAVAGPPLARRLGEERVLVAAMLLLAVGLVLRSAGGTSTLLVGTVVLGAAVAVANVLLPGLIKRDFPEQVGLLTGIYTMFIALGAAIAAGATVPIEQATGMRWRGALLVWAVPAVVAALVWYPLARRRRRSAVAATHLPAGSLLRDRLAWSLVTFFGLQSLTYYAQLTWLPALFVDGGVSRTAAGLLLSLIQFVTIPASLIVPTLAARSPTQVPYVFATISCTILGFLGLLLVPGSVPYLWAVLLGLGGAAFPLGLTLVVLRTRTGEQANELSSMTQGGGYLIAAAGPVIIGALHDATGSWDVPLIVLLVVLVPVLVAGSLAGRNRYVRVPAQLHPQPPR